MGFVANVSLVHPDLVLAPTIETHPAVTIRHEYEITSSETDLCFVSVFGGQYAAIEEAMERDHTITQPTRVATFENRAIYRVTVETDLEVVPHRCAADGAFVFKITSGERGWVIRVHMPDRDALTDFREYCRNRSISFRVNQLYESTASDDGIYYLTEQQHEILSMAYYEGYYDIPRRASQNDLAGQLGISDSAVSQRLRRAVSELIAATLEDDRTLQQ
ncbi:helix-turn-helix domain-containing protein [Natrialbaceae archaeon A-gly3]